MPEKYIEEKNAFQPIFHQVLEELYPRFFGCINAMSSLLSDNTQLIETGLLRTSLEHLNKSVDELYRKEKLVLFPYIIEVAEQRQMSKLAAFDWVHNSHKDILNQLKKYKELVFRVILDTPDSEGVLSDMNRNINEFEDAFLYMQVMVEEKLIRKLTISSC